MIFKPTA